MKTILIVVGLSLSLAACSNNTGNYKASPNDTSKIDTAAAKDLDTASEIIGSGMVHP